MASLSTMMPLNIITELKYMFQGAFGCSPFTCLKSIHDRRAKISLEHELMWFLHLKCWQDRNILRVKDPLDVVPKPVIGLQEASLLERLPCSASGQLRLLFSVEKGGSSTKLVLQVLKMRHSTPTA